MRDPRDHRMSLDPREHIRVMDPMARDPRMTDMRGDPRGISGRLNGANADAMWGQPPGPPHHQMAHQHPSGPPAKMLNPSSINQWAAPPPKDIMPGKPSGWEEPSPPTQRRNVPNFDDGTSLWGNPATNHRAVPGSKVTQWTDPTKNLGRGGLLFIFTIFDLFLRKRRLRVCPLVISLNHPSVNRHEPSEINDVILIKVLDEIT